jgi:hypothetical protein
MALPLGFAGCASSGGEGSETHFVKCGTDSDCIAANAGDLCVDRKCTLEGGAGGSRSTGGTGAGGSRSTGGTTPSTGGNGAAGTPDVPLPSHCAGLDAASCFAAPPCSPAAGRSADAPDDLVFAGCRTAIDDGGNAVPLSTAITCARSAPGEACYLFLDSAVPDGWEKLVACSDLPDDCGVDGNRHPALGN